MNNKITKKEVKELLSVSDRTIERYVKKGYLSPIRDNGKPFKVYFDEKQVKELQELLTTTSKMPDEEKLLGRAIKHIFEGLFSRDKSDKETSSGTSKEHSIAAAFYPKFDPASLFSTPGTSGEAGEKHIDALKNEIIFLLPSLKPYLVELLKDLPSQLDVKLFLSMDEVTLLSGIPIEEVELAIKTGQLRVIKFGSQLRVKRSDLDEYIRNLLVVDSVSGG